MILELLAPIAAVPATAGELLERTASTARVQDTVRLSLAPAFLLAAIGAVMNVMMSRLIWIANRIDRLCARMKDERSVDEEWELVRLGHRRSLAQKAVMLSTAAALIIALVIALLFVSAFIEPRIGTLIAICWIAAMACLVSGLLMFARETMLAARGQTGGPRDGGS